MIEKPQDCPVANAVLQPRQQLEISRHAVVHPMEGLLGELMQHHGVLPTSMYIKLIKLYMYSFQPWKNIVNHIFCQLIRLIHYVLFVLFGVVFLEPVDPNELSAGNLAPPSCAKYGYLTTMKSQMWSTRKSGATCVFLHTIIYIYILCSCSLYLLYFFTQINMIIFQV